MTGAILNAIGILIGGIIGLARTSPLAPQTQAFFKVALGVFTVFYGLRLTWLSINGPFSIMLKQILIAFLAVMVGKFLGHLLHLQALSNRAGQYARLLIEQAHPDQPPQPGSGLTACAILFCASPLGLLGAVHDGLRVEPNGWSYFYPLAVKGVMDALAMTSFVRIFGWNAMVSALPVLVLQGTITLACALYAEPFLRQHGLVDAVNAVGGLVICTIGLVIFEVKKVELADYLPSLAIAPLITWFWK